MITFSEIDTARKCLKLPVEASLSDIKKQHRSLVAQWHPDRCREGDREKAEEMTAQLNHAYQVLCSYCENFDFSFAESDVTRNLSPGALWFQKFMDDPVWGRWKKKKKE